ncbi:MAG: acyl-CoA carboxylase subunit beta [Desulfomonile tiedjei]|uniref:Acyl-CoA carboxylase subunit beta n=1 Tax=Desulfomonile tiedjei TaxID=2358 RepID=A0A9D6VBL1_9BACT|nr:acyl-CoA carboxylase subunit beta [Desulfomonile tiedjei]
MDRTKTWDQELAKLESKNSEAQLGGGEDRLQRQRDMGKMTARERIDYILDPDSFTELNMLAEHQCRDFGMDKKKFVGDGVVTGYGTMDGRRVYIYSEDDTVLGGSTGKVHGAKIHYILRLAREHMVPVIGLNDSAGARIQEGMDNVYGITGMFFQNTLNSGIVPQIAAIMGACTGGAAYSAALCDFIVQVEKTSHMFITGPAVVKVVTGEEVTFEDLGGAKVHATKSGVSHLTAKDDRECLDLIRRLLSYLPQNNLEKPQKKQTNDPVDRSTTELLEIVPIHKSRTYDMKKVILAIVDDKDFFEIQPGFAKNVVIGFARMGGRTVGIVANNPMILGGCLDIDSSDKAARFVRTCDVFNIPVVTLVDVPGFLPGVHQEHGGIIRHGAKLLHAWTEATVPKISCILRKMYGGAIPAMGVHQIGFDQVFAWPSAEMQMLGAEPSVRILYRRELEAAEDSEAFLQQKIEEYQNLYLTPYHAASLSVIDAVIRPEDSRKRIISALEIMEDKVAENRPFRKHTNIPL